MRVNEINRMSVEPIYTEIILTTHSLNRKMIICKVIIDYMVKILFMYI